MMKHLIATITNIFYGLAGLELYRQDPTLWPVSAFLVALMLGSGYHHYLLESWSRWADFVGMYLALSSIALFSIIGGLPNAGLSICWAVGLYLIFGSNVKVILGLIGAALVSLLYASGWQLEPLLQVSAFAAISMVFNYQGDKLHKENHDLIHGLGWHIPTAYALYLTAIQMI